MNVHNLANDNSYKFKEMPSKIVPKTNLKKHKNSTRILWSWLAEKGWEFLGVVREWTAIFRKGAWHIAIHHFIDESPMSELIDKPVLLSPCEIIGDEKIAYEIIKKLYDFKFSITVPQQAFTDALILDTCGCEYNWHYDSPKHKFMVWAQKDNVHLLIEYFHNMPFAPYGVTQKMGYPCLALEYVQPSFFEEDFPPEKQKKNRTENGEIIDFIRIPEEMPKEVLERAEKAIERVFKDFKRISVAYSGGKDSTVVLLLVFRYLLKHPDCKHEITIVSADTLVDNPLILRHLLKMKKVIENYCRKIRKEIPFILVKPYEGQDFFLVYLVVAMLLPPVKIGGALKGLRLFQLKRSLSSYLELESQLVNYLVPGPQKVKIVPAALNGYMGMIFTVSIPFRILHLQVRLLIGQQKMWLRFWYVRKLLGTKSIQTINLLIYMVVRRHLGNVQLGQL